MLIEIAFLIFTCGIEHSVFQLSNKYALNAKILINSSISLYFSKNTRLLHFNEDTFFLLTFSCKIFCFLSFLILNF